MPDARRAPYARPGSSALHDAAATILAVPVILLVIAESLARRVGRPAIVVVLLILGTTAYSVVWTTPLAASRSTASRSIADDEFRPVATPAPTNRPTPQAVIGAVPTSRSSLEPAPAPEPPTIIRFRPRDGWTGVSRFAPVSVRFSQPMDRASTERAFRITADQKRVTGKVRWAEGDTVLVVDPSRPLPYRARVTLSVDRGARSTDGTALNAARSVRFTVEPRPAPARLTPRPSPETTAWRWPLIGPITQRFGEYKTRYGFHQGIDIDGQTGDRVRAARGGRVILAGYGDACGGLQVRIDHGNGFESWYRHLSGIDVKRGAVVTAGTLVGRVGDTGCSLGSHLHFGIRRNGTFVDPLRYLPPR